ncbi:DUF397 domain-containing protein [Streptomyces sp. NPDC054770]
MHEVPHGPVEVGGALPCVVRCDGHGARSSSVPRGKDRRFHARSPPGESSYSGGNSGESCLEIAPTPTTIHIRDSKYTHTPATPGPRLTLAPSAWSAFLPYASAH